MLLGAGTRLFSETDEPQQVPDVVESRTCATGVVELGYAVPGREGATA